MGEKERSKKDVVRRSPSRRKVIKFKCKVTIKAGKGLTPKDQILMGLIGRSDPYVEVWANGKLQGKTPVKKYTLDPVWETDNTFEIQMEEAYHLPPPKLELKIWDEDIGQDPDAMGTVTLIVPARTEETTEWYPVPPHSAKNAKGELQITLKTERERAKGREARSGKRGKRGEKGRSKSPTRNHSKSPTREKSGRTRSKSPTREKSGRTGSKSPTREKSGRRSKSPTRERSGRSKSPARRKRSKSPAKSKSSAGSRSRSKSPEGPSRHKSTPVDLDLDFGQVSYRKGRRSMTDPEPELPQLKIHECDVELNESSYWDGRVEELGWEIEDLHSRINNTKVFKPTDSRNSIAPIVDHLQQEVRRRTHEREVRLQKQFKDNCTHMKVKLRIIQGIGLAAKDADEYGNMVSSDPYVEVWKDRKILGKTMTQDQTLDPIWNEQFVFMVDKQILPKIALRLWDEDEDDEPDCLGSVTIKIPADVESSIKEWYEIPSVSNAENDAEGSIQVYLETQFDFDAKQRAEEMQKEVDELEQQLKASLIASNEKTEEGQNSLEPAMRYLKERNKQLIQESVLTGGN